ncbi:MAG TPA: ferrochelatase [Candidatus Binatia bacterium]|nr:ferrochelatase [Candidatus Binatia bacterium]
MEHALNGILLVNLGTPAAPTPAAVRAFLREFLSDPRVVDLPRVLWLPVLYGVVLPLRPRRVARQYAHIWRPEGSPLLHFSRGLAAGLAGRAAGAPLALAMRYGEPSIAGALAQLRTAGASRLTVLPLYPQYSRTTTASALDAVRAALALQDWRPEVRVVEQYADDARYIALLAQSVRAHWARHGRGDRLLISFHGLPSRLTEAGDPYEGQCRATAGALARALELAPEHWTISFQSRVGRARWTGPYTEEVLRALPVEGVRRLDVICPGFPVDCLETLEEIAVRGHATFRTAGGEALRYIPALNDDPEHAALLAQLAAA